MILSCKYANNKFGVIDKNTTNKDLTQKPNAKPESKPVFTTKDVVKKLKPEPKFYSSKG